MKTDEHLILDLLGEPGVRYVVPAYQRPYSWGLRQCEELWLDVHRAAKAETRHFIGTFLYASETCDDQGFPRRAVIDGQQRLVTVTLILVALVEHLRRTDAVLADSALVGDDATFSDGVSEDDVASIAADRDAGSSASASSASLDDALSPIDAATIESRYLLLGTDAEAPGKLVLSRNDRATLFALVEGGEVPEDAPEALVGNLAFFRERMEDETFDAEQLWAGLGQLFVIDAQVDESDNAHLIFESLNSKGKPLSTADLVRNYLLLAESHAEQARLYDEYWDPIEGMFQPDPGSLRLDNAIQGWLSVRFRKVRAKGAGEVYSVFKRYVEDEFTGTTESLLRELRSFCLVWAENYRYHAVKKYKSAFKWAENGPSTLVSQTRKKSVDENYAQRVRRDLDATDASL